MAVNTAPTLAEMLAVLGPSNQPGVVVPPAYYGMVILGLANQAYSAQGSAWNVIQSTLYTAITETKYTPPLPSPGQPGVASPTPLSGTWSLDWGPANGQNGDGDNSNLIYIASYRAQNNSNYAQNAPYFFVVSIRGTDTSVTGTPLYQQLLQDIRDFSFYSWSDLLAGKCYHQPVPPPILPPERLTVPTPNTQDTSALSGNVATGSSLGFVRIANSSAPLNDGQPPSNNGTALTVVQALNDLLGNYPGTPIVVTGHSLGACRNSAHGVVSRLAIRRRQS